MPAQTIGGAIVKQLDITQSWGIEPAGASVVALGPMVPPDTAATLVVGGKVFYGLVTNCVETKDEGRSIRISLADNRIRLKWDTVYCSFNIIEIIEYDPLTPGVDRKRRYKHVLPQNWETGLETITATPYTAMEILTYLEQAPDVNFAWAFGSHPNLQSPIFNIDASQGKKLSNVLQEICEQCNVQCTLQGQQNIIFSVKGDGSAPPPPASSSNRSKGLAIGAETRIRMVGDRNIYQVTPLDLEPDWNAHYQDYWFEPAWVARVKSVFGITGPYEAAARAREVTLREYCTKTSKDNADLRLWQDIGRMELPVWIYVRQIVFKSYRVPLKFKLNDKLPLSCLEISDGLLCDITWTTGGILIVDSTNPQNFYPQSSAFALVQGMPIDLADPMLADALTPEKISKTLESWSSNTKFRIDQKNKALVFENAIFTPGSGPNGLVIKANTIADDPTNKAELEYLMVPNAAAVISPAKVQASICFAAERYSKWFGSGPRQTFQYVSGLQRHIVGLPPKGAEIPYLSENQKADELAQKFANSLLTRQLHIVSGGHTRHGTAGTSLTGAIDRVSAGISFSSGSEGEGISEELDYAKERQSQSFQPERELERRARSQELFPGQKELKTEIQQTRLLGKIRPNFKSKTAFDAPTDFVTARASISVICDSDFSYPVGMPVFAKASSDSQGALQVDQTGSFIGCLAAANTPAKKGTPLPVHSEGLVRCRVKGPFNKGDIVGVKTGDNFAKVGESQGIGSVQQSYVGTETIVAIVRLASSRIQAKPFELILVSDGSTKKIRVVYSTLAGGLPSGFSYADDPPYLLTPTGTSGVVCGGVTIEESYGSILPNGRFLAIYPEVPVNTTDTFYQEIGSYSLDGDTLAVVNARYGPIDATICRNWFAAEAPFWGVTFIGS